MTKIIAKILLALCKDIDSILAFFEAHQTKLDEFAHKLNNQAVASRQAAREHELAAERHEAEAARAKRVSERVSALLS